MFIILNEIVWCLLKYEKHEIEEKHMCFEKCFFGILNKYLMIIFMRNEIIIIKNWPNCERKKKWCRLMVKAFLLLSGKNGAI